MTLPDPPLIPHFLFEEPWPLVITLAACGLVLLYHGNRRQSRRGVLTGLLALLLAGGVLTAASAVTTPREQLIARTGAMLDATAPLDAGKLRAFFAPGATLTGPDGAAWLQRDEMIDACERAVKRFAIRGHHVIEIAAEERSPDAGATEMEVRTVIGSEFGERPVATRWLLTWSRQGDGLWRVTSVRWLRLGEFAPPYGVWR